ncbi:hypothetical protein J5N97_001214 [Dioscorea zingiberensis]|uniref:starch synthase n=1 Tax=Dioscorea zingiberensis TaxID=325984 RepID=A0A9D5H2J9_9LILI|nr:hypothetical protein J5N97_001214 [Dioscorea zingiberensis]
MEMTLHPHRPLCCRTAPGERIRPALGSFNQSFPCCKMSTGVRSVHCIVASSDYSRRRPKKGLGPRTRGNGPKGFSPRPQVGTSTQKKDQNGSEENEQSATSSSVRTSTGILDEAEEHSHGVEDGMDKNMFMENKSETFDNNEDNGQRAEVEYDGDGINSTEKHLAVGCNDEGIEKEKVSNSDGVVTELKNHIIDEPDIEETLLRKEYMDAQEHKRMLEDLAKTNLSSGNIVFVYPQLVRPDQNIEVFLNRSLSSLVNENDVFIMGAFNGWRWKSFTERLQRTNLEGDWWSCLLYIPKEAYEIDFVFFNGGNVYENNDSKDFSVPVEGGMDAPAFEDFMLEEKRKELERLAAEQAERERQAEEERQKEAEKAAIDSDRAQAKLDVEKKRESLQKAMQLAKISEENVWRIEPSAFKSGDRVCLFYNRSFRPLSQATEIWIHGGHNNWIEGLSIVERLLRSDEKDGDWWYAQVSIPDRALVVDWVFADGPPQKAKVYDNNNRLDFHAIVPKSISEELFWVEEEHRIFRKLQEERKLKQEASL